MPVQSPRFLQNTRIKEASENKPPLKQGERGEAVVILQLALIDLGNPMPKSTRNGQGMPDGIFGPETFQLVGDFQRANGLAADGVVGHDTLAELDRQIIELITQRAAAATAQVQRAKVS
jgi:peptidoglycan hydrolase-like protein with peptidoglycan-binding domain